MRWFQPVLLVALSAGVLHAEPAAAQVPPAAAETPSPEQVNKANALFREALAFVAAKQWAKAEQKLLSARALNPTFDIAANLGHVQFELGKMRDAAENLSFALRHWPVAGKTTEQRDLARKRFEQARAQIAALTVQVNLPGAEISVDGKQAGRSPMSEPIFLDPGTHTIEAAFAGYERGTQKIEAAKGATLTASLTLKLSAGASTVAAPPKAESSEKPQSPAKPTEGNQPALSTQPVKPQPVKPQPAEGSESPVRGIVIGAGAVTSATLIGLGIGFAVAWNQKTADTDAMLMSLEQANGTAPCRASAESSPACQHLRAALEAQGRYQNAAFFTLIAGGVAGAGTLIYALVTPKKSKASAVQALPVAAAGSGGIIVRGTW